MRDSSIFIIYYRRIIGGLIRYFYDVEAPNFTSPNLFGPSPGFHVKQLYSPSLYGIVIVADKANNISLVDWTSDITGLLTS